VKNLDLSESAVIRIASLNRFQVSLSSEQKIKLVKIENKIVEVVRKRVPSLEKNLNF